MLAAGIWHVHTHVVGAMLSTYLPIVGTVYLILYSMTAIPEGSKIDTLGYMLNFNVLSGHATSFQEN